MKKQYYSKPVYCDRCQGTGRVPWDDNARPDETDECTVCEGHGEHYYYYSHIIDKLENKWRVGDR